jgi:hypothetical protein
VNVSWLRGIFGDVRAVARLPNERGSGVFRPLGDDANFVPAIDLIAAKELSFGDVDGAKLSEVARAAIGEAFRRGHSSTPSTRPTEAREASSHCV